MHLPSVLPDETLFSRFVRYLSISGVREDHFLQQFFHKSRVSVHPYLTIGISRAARVSEENELQLFNEQTLGRLFAYFLPNRVNDIFFALRSDDGGAAFRACQLVSFKESEKLSLKYCPLCAKQDIKWHGVSYWHCIHQVPGLEACPHHQAWLIHQELPARPHLKPHLLPSCEVLVKPSSMLSYYFSQYVLDYLKSTVCTSDHYNQKQLISRMHRFGYITKANRFRRKKLSEDFFNFVMSMKYPSSRLLPRSENDYRYLSYLLSEKVSQHPFKYLLLEFWLSTLRDNYLEKDEDIVEIPSLESDGKIQGKCTSLLQQGVSMSEITKLTGKSRCYLKLLAIRKKYLLKQNLAPLRMMLRKTSYLWLKEVFIGMLLHKNFKYHRVVSSK